MEAWISEKEALATNISNAEKSEHAVSSVTQANISQWKKRLTELEDLIASLTVVQEFAARELTEQERSEVIQVSSALASWKMTRYKRSMSC